MEYLQIVKFVNLNAYHVSKGKIYVLNVEETELLINAYVLKVNMMIFHHLIVRIVILFANNV